MKREHYKLISGHPLRELLNEVTGDRRDLPGKTALRERIAEALPDGTAAEHEALFKQAVTLAKEAAGAKGRFQTRGESDEWLGQWLAERAEADRLLPTPAEPDVDHAALAADIRATEGQPTDPTTVRWRDGAGNLRTQAEG